MKTFVILYEIVGFPHSWGWGDAIFSSRSRAEFVRRLEVGDNEDFPIVRHIFECVIVDDTVMLPSFVTENDERADKIRRALAE